LKIKKPFALTKLQYCFEQNKLHGNVFTKITILKNKSRFQSYFRALKVSFMKGKSSETKTLTYEQH